MPRGKVGVMLVSFSHRRFGQFLRFVGAGGSDVQRRWFARGGIAAVAAVIAVILQSALVAITPAYAATPLNVFVGYMDTHSAASSTKQPRPWPYTDPTSYVGSPCPAYPSSTTCWDAAAIRLDNPGSIDVTGVHLVVAIGSHTYNLWGTSVTVKAHGTLVLTETGGQNSTNFDATDFSPNAYNGGNTASCVNSGAIPDVRITIGGATTSYLDSGQVLNGRGVDAGHCVNGAFVSGRLDESHPWAQIGTAAATAPTAPRSLAAVGADGSVISPTIPKKVASYSRYWGMRMITRRDFVSLAAATRRSTPLASAQSAPAAKGARSRAFTKKGCPDPLPGSRLRLSVAGHPGGGLNSRISNWATAVFNAPEVFKNDFRASRWISVTPMAASRPARSRSTILGAPLRRISSG